MHITAGSKNNSKAEIIHINNPLLNFFFYLSLLVLCFSRIDAEELPWVTPLEHGKELEIVLPFLKENPIILEAGAYNGDDTNIIARKWPKGSIFAFEPNPNSFQLLQKKTTGLNNVKLFPFGLYSKSGSYKFNVSITSEGASSLLEGNHVAGIEYIDQPITVFCMNLDEWANLNGIDHIDYMWLDMEGTELHMLKTSPKMLQTVQAISTEINFQEFRKGMTLFPDLKLFLEKEGFILYKLWIWDETQPNLQGTAVFIRESLHH